MPGRFGEGADLTLDALVRNGVSGRVRGAGTALRPVRVDRDAAGETEIWWRAGTELRPPLDVELYGLIALYRLRLEEGRREGGCLVTPLPERVDPVFRRRFRRGPAPAGARLMYRLPGGAGATVETGLRDIALGGIAFPAPEDARSRLRPGAQLCDVSVALDRDAVFTVDAEVREGPASSNGQPPVCRLRIDGASTDDLAAWRVAAAQHLTPRTRIGATWSERQWRLYEASAYFSLSGKSRAEFADLKQKFKQACARLHTAPNLGCQVVWTHDRDIHGTLSHLKAYSRTWMGHQLAKRSGPSPDGVRGGQVLRELYQRAYEHALSDPDLEWLCGYFKPEIEWMTRAHSGVVEAIGDPRVAATFPFTLMEGVALTRRLPHGADAISVGCPGPKELAKLLSAVQRTRPAIYSDALDLRPDRFGLGPVRARMSAAGLEREREVRVARRAGRPVAVAVIESAESGLNLFRLCDGVRLFSLTATPDEPALTALLEEAAVWYGDHGKDAFTYFCEISDTRHATAAGLESLDLGRMWILSAKRIPEFLEHVYLATAPRAS